MGSIRFIYLGLPDDIRELVCDIGKLLETHRNIRTSNISRDNIYRILKREPDVNPLSYPRTRQSTGCNRQFQPTWTKKFSWLHYSHHVDGVFCRACVFFAPDEVCRQSLRQFVTAPFKAWIKMSDKATAHARNDYHQSSMAKMNEFLRIYNNPSQGVNTLLDSEAHRIIERNRKVIESLLKIVILCGKQGLAFRGHRDDNVNWVLDEDRGNDGNFIEIIRFRAETDPILANHLVSAPRNAKYTSKTIQNELISVVGQKIQKEILDEVKRAHFYSVIADEVTDAANKEELSLVLRYFTEDGIKEVFVDFIEVERITGNILGKAILQWLHSHDLPVANICGQCYDGASNMSGAKSGCKTIIQKEAPLAMYFHCAAHRLNLALVSSCSILAFKSAESCIGEIARFFSYSAKRQRLLDKAIEVKSHSRANKLKDACRTRWVDRIESYTIFMELHEAIHSSLDAMAHPSLHTDLGTDWGWDGETVTRANGFLYQLQSPTFLVSFHILLQVMTLLKDLTVKLQMQAIDVIYAYNAITSVVSTFKSLRLQSGLEFKKVFASATKMGVTLHGEGYQLTKPRITGRQIHRNNPPCSSPEDFYRITLYDEFLSHIVSELESRFVENPASRIVLGIMKLLPSDCVKSVDEESLPNDLVHTVQFYEAHLPHPVMIETEFNTWRAKWRHSGEDPPNKLVDAFKLCSSFQFPNLHTLLRIAITLPITSCESERSFSQLNLLKTARRSTMSDTRLSSLAIMKVNRDRCNNLTTPMKLKQLVEDFTKLHPRRMALSFMLQD